MRAEILTIGDELCRGEIVDTNSSYLAQRLWDLDITTRWMTSCCDDENDITTALDQAVNRADLVVCSGGLGPTEDDLTVDMVAKLADADVVIDEVARRRMEERFAGRIEVTEIQLRQVRVPAKARVYVNPAGLAPSFEVAIRGVPVCACLAYRASCTRSSMRTSKRGFASCASRGGLRSGSRGGSTACSVRESRRSRKRAAG